MKEPFVYQPPSDEHIKKIQEVRDKCAELYSMLLENVPQSAERTIAIRKLQQVLMWAIKAIVYDGEYYVQA